MTVSTLSILNSSSAIASSGTADCPVIQLIGNTKTTAGLRIRAELDEHPYPLKEMAPPAQLANVRLKPEEFHGEWNYTIIPH